MPPLRPIGIDRLLVNIQSAFQVVKCDPPTGIGHVVRQFLFPLLKCLKVPRLPSTLRLAFCSAV
jgi:hypothetical protein